MPVQTDQCRNPGVSRRSGAPAAFMGSVHVETWYQLVKDRLCQRNTDPTKETFESRGTQQMEGRKHRHAQTLYVLRLLCYPCSGICLPGIISPCFRLVTFKEKQHSRRKTGFTLDFLASLKVKASACSKDVKGSRT